MTILETKRHYLEDGQEPTLPFLIEFMDGKRGEAISPLYLMDLIIHPDFSDVDDIETLYLLTVKKLRDIAGTTFSTNRVHTRVYDGIGPFYGNQLSRHEDEVKEEKEIEFVNDEPIILDGWDSWTAVASLIKSGYIKLYERYPVWSDEKKEQGCKHCSFKKDIEGHPYCIVWESSNVFDIWDNICPFVTSGSEYLDYYEVKSNDIVDPSYKKDWLPIEKRTKEHIGYRRIEK